MNDKLISKEEAVQALYERSLSFTEAMFATPSECNVAKIVALECASIIQNMPDVDMEGKDGRSDQ